MSCGQMQTIYEGRDGAAYHGYDETHNYTHNYGNPYSDTHDEIHGEEKEIENMMELEIENSIFKNVMNAWLKFGTAMLIYRLGTYCMVDKCQGPLFDKNQVLAALFILLGFTLYFLLIDPFLPKESKHPILLDLMDDMLMFGTVMVAARGFETLIFKGGNFYDNNWGSSLVYVLIGFAIYRVIVYPFIPDKAISHQIRPITEDWLQFGVAYAVITALGCGASGFNLQWVAKLVALLLGFTGYHLITKHLVKVI
jgi:hypothetical protein